MRRVRMPLVALALLALAGCAQTGGTRDSAYYGAGIDGYGPYGPTAVDAYGRWDAWDRGYWDPWAGYGYGVFYSPAPWSLRYRYCGYRRYCSPLWGDYRHGWDFYYFGGLDAWWWHWGRFDYFHPWAGHGYWRRHHRDRDHDRDPRPDPGPGTSPVVTDPEGRLRRTPGDWRLPGEPGDPRRPGRGTTPPPPGGTGPGGPEATPMPRPVFQGRKEPGQGRPPVRDVETPAPTPMPRPVFEGRKDPGQGRPPPREVETPAPTPLPRPVFEDRGNPGTRPAPAREPVRATPRETPAPSWSPPPRQERPAPAWTPPPPPPRAEPRERPRPAEKVRLPSRNEDRDGLE